MHILAAAARDEQQLASPDVLEQQLSADGPVVTVLRVGGTAGDIVEQRVVVVALKREAGVDALPERAVHRALDVHQVMRAEGHIRESVVVIRGAPRHEVRKAAGRVAAKQRALRATQNFHPLHVEHREGQPRHLADVDVVDVDGSRTLLMVREIVLRDAADRQTEG